MFQRNPTWQLNATSLLACFCFEFKFIIADDMMNYQTLNNKIIDQNTAVANLKCVFDSIEDAIFVCDENKHCLFFNSVAKQIIGDQLTIPFCQELIRLFELEPSERINASSNLFLIQINGLLEASENNCLKIIINYNKHFNDIWLEVTYKYLKNRDGLVTGLIIICRDITKNKQVEGKKIHESCYDTLTGLPGLNVLSEHIQQAICLVKQRENYMFAVLFLDIDRFKFINNSYGRLIGDNLLVAISERLKTCLRSKDLIARLGSDEFAILLEDIKDANYVVEITERIYRNLRLPFYVKDHEIFANLKIGIAVSTAGYNQPEELLQDAELAMSYSKRRGQAQYQIFSQALQVREIAFLQLENDLQRAMENQEFQLYYQPILSLELKTITGFEALLRWQHPTRGLVPPSEFVSVAEETGLINRLGKWVLREACRQLCAWQSKFFHATTWKMCVNISGKQLTEVNFAEEVKQILQDTDLKSCNLKLEITESSLLENTDSIINILKQLQGLGIEFSLDDFGTGYSSLSYLHQFPVNTLKIDRSFVKDIETNGEKLGIIRAIISLARSLSMDVVAEGIETAQQLAQLKILKCQHGQGYFFAKPLNSQAAEAFITAELVKRDRRARNSQANVEEQLSKEKLLVHVESLHQQLESLKQEKIDLEIMLETATEHADLVESELQKEINNRYKVEVALQQANQELEQLAIVDSLTGVANRRRFDDYLLQEWQRLSYENAPMSLIMCDVDYFKLYNDTYGHQTGDRCLQRVALAIEHTLASFSALVARYGGEEFAVILSNINTTEAMKTAEIIRVKIQELKIAHHKSPINEYVTLSLGIFSLTPTQKVSPELLITFADRALYDAKVQGRNRSVLALA